MTRKDYVLIADVLSCARKWSTPENMEGNHKRVIDRLAQVFSDELQSDNPAFNREHFLSVVRGEKSLQSRPERKR